LIIDLEKDESLDGFRYLPEMLQVPEKTYETIYGYY
jgi:hypothetical protein